VGVGWAILPQRLEHVPAGLSASGCAWGFVTRRQGDAGRLLCSSVAPSVRVANRACAGMGAKSQALGADLAFTEPSQTS
jgi:hypothetical protein